MSQLFKLSLIVLSSVTIAQLSVSSFASEATYRLSVVNTWTATDYPANFPGGDHWAMLGGGTFLSSESVFDFNDDGAVNFLDLSTLSNSFLGQPGPSATGTCPVN